MPKTKQAKLTYDDFVNNVEKYVDDHGMDGKRFVEANAKWLDIYYSNHDNKAFSDLIEDERFKLELGIPKKKRVRKKNGTSEGEKEKQRG